MAMGRQADTTHALHGFAMTNVPRARSPRGAVVVVVVVVCCVSVCVCGWMGGWAAKREAVEVTCGRGRGGRWEPPCTVRKSYVHGG